MKKNNSRKMTSVKNNSLGFNLLNVGLFIAIVFAIVLIGTYQYTPKSSTLKGELASLSGSGESREYLLNQLLGLGFIGGDEYLDWGGRNEKWMTGSGSMWYYITPDGKVYQWLGGSLDGDPLVGQVSSAAYIDTSLLYNAKVSGDTTAPTISNEIGRASCRERV